MPAYLKVLAYPKFEYHLKNRRLRVTIKHTRHQFNVLSLFIIFRAGATRVTESCFRHFPTTFRWSCEFVTCIAVYVYNAWSISTNCSSRKKVIQLTKHLMEAIQKLFWSVKFRQNKIYFILTSVPWGFIGKQSLEWHNFSRKIVWYCRLPLLFPLMLACILTVHVSELHWTNPRPMQSMKLIINI